MTHTYNITGMTCNGCVAKVKSALLKMGDITEAEVQLQAPQGKITMQNHIPTDTLQAALTQAGNYTITSADCGMAHAVTGATEDNRSWVEIYKPILLIFGYLPGITLLVEYMNEGFSLMRWMNNFMAGFFLIFSFFKFLNLKGFAESYAMYDIVAKRWNGWGYVYAFLELGLGIAFLIGFDPVITNAAALVIMSISIIGVLQSVLNKRKIKCACLGDVFNLPMSTLTILEDVIMIVMSGTMLVMMR
ncbi:MAG: MauE/DoxX family redox-associated membrane protein [Ferruginibacter sp.]